MWHVGFEKKRLAGRLVKLSLGRLGASSSGAGEINGFRGCIVVATIGDSLVS